MRKLQTSCCKRFFFWLLQMAGRLVEVIRFDITVTQEQCKFVQCENVLESFIFIGIIKPHCQELPLFDTAALRMMTSALIFRTTPNLLELYFPQIIVIFQNALPSWTWLRLNAPLSRPPVRSYFFRSTLIYFVVIFSNIPPMLDVLTLLRS